MPNIPISVDYAVKPHSWKSKTVCVDQELTLADLANLFDSPRVWELDVLGKTRVRQNPNARLRPGRVYRLDAPERIEKKLDQLAGRPYINHKTFEEF